MLFYILLGVVGVVLIIGLFIVNLVNNAVVKSIHLMVDANPFLRENINGVGQLEGHPGYADRRAWAEANEFEPELHASTNATLDGSSIDVAVWKNAYKNTCMASYTGGGKVTCEFVTTLGEDGGLTTSNALDSVLFPSRPTHYTQAFDGAELSELYKQHEEALLFLLEKKKLVPVDRQGETLAQIEESVQLQCAFIQSLPLWKFSGAYWYFVRRPRLKNKSIAERYSD